jgi:hypothetical protein
MFLSFYRLQPHQQNQINRASLELDIKREMISTETGQSSPCVINELGISWEWVDGSGIRARTIDVEI